MLERWKRSSFPNKTNMIANALTIPAATAALVLSALTLWLNFYSFKLDQRPWIGVYSERTKLVSAGYPLEVNFELKNFGKSPASGTSLSVYAFPLLRQASTTDEEFENQADRMIIASIPKLTGKVSIGSVPPTSQSQVPMSIPMITPTEVDLSAIHQKYLRYYIFGVITYGDSGSNSHHQTQFCFKVDEDIGDLVDPTGFMVHACKSWNSMT